MRHPRRWPRLRLLAITLVAAGALAGCVPLYTVVQNRAIVTVTGLPASGTIAPGERLTDLNVAASFEQPAVLSEGWAPEYGRVASISVTFKYTSNDGQAKASKPYATGWGSFALPADAKPGTTLDVVTTVRSQTAQSEIVWLDGQKRGSYAEYSETSAQLRVTGGGGGSGGTPTARLLQSQMPVAPRGAVMQATFPGLVDARQSTDPAGGALTYSWDLNGDGAFGDDPLAAYRDNGNNYPVAATLPAGMAWIERGDAYTGGAYPKVSVRVSTAAGASNTATADIRVMTPGSGLLSFGAASGGSAYAPTTFAPGADVDLYAWSPINNANTTITGGGSAWGTFACFDVNGDGTYGDPVYNLANVQYPRGLVPMGPTRTGSPVRFAAPASQGQHVIRAVVWDPTNRSDGFVDGCATPLQSPNPHATPGVASQLAALISVSGARARQGAAKQFTASSTLRLNPTSNPVPGKLDDNGVARGVVTRGTFTFKTPARAGKVKRPAGLGDLARGTYVARAATSTISGTGESGKAVYTGVSTVLLRGKNGTLACITADASIASTILTMRGGSKGARKLVFTATQTQTPFTLPTIAEYAKQANAKKPPKAKPINGKGPITASTGKKARGLNGTCKGLRKYLR